WASPARGRRIPRIQGGFLTILLECWGGTSWGVHGRTQAAGGGEAGRSLVSWASGVQTQGAEGPSGFQAWGAEAGGAWDGGASLDLSVEAVEGCCLVPAGGPESLGST
ncbi:MAG: hypothetical protein GY707_19100, partial [Desulfobacteraceae bacterium]|nr:hypothetical protein [Desulfobacteraceae bacterium]